jgi:aryl-alcohol dehydrogenase-like predicted oxidoreductase
MSDSPISMRAFGTSGQQVTLVGLGGEGVLRTYGRDREAEAVINEAIAQGITYFDCAHAYAGSEGYYGRVWSRRPADRAQVFQTSKSAMRRKAAALAELDLTLQTMAIDALDLWQIHDVRTVEDFEAIAGPGGALEAFVAAKSAGKTRTIGVTGHHDPAVLTRALREWPVDAVLLPVNPVESVLGGFLDATLPTAQEKGIAVIAMKVLGAAQYLSPNAGITAATLLRFALSQPISTAIVGCSTVDEVRTLAEVGAHFQPLPPIDQQNLVERFRPYARRLAFYRGTL